MQQPPMPPQHYQQPLQYQQPQAPPPPPPAQLPPDPHFCYAVSEWGAGMRTYTGLLKKQYVLPYGDIAAVNIERAAVLIVQRDTGKTWQSLNVRTMPNVGVLQRLIAR